MQIIHDAVDNASASASPLLCLPIGQVTTTVCKVAYVLKKGAYRTDEVFGACLQPEHDKRDHATDTYLQVDLTRHGISP